MSTVLSSISEISRVGGWALRGAGYPFGVAERGVRLLAWAEAVGCKAIRSLRLSETAIETSVTAPSVVHLRDGGGKRVVHANGRHLLEVGGPIIDLVTHDARTGPHGQAFADGLFGFTLLPPIINLLAHRKHCGVVVYRAAEDDHLPDELPRTGWVAVGSADSAGQFACGTLDDEAGARTQIAAIVGGGSLPGSALHSLINEIRSLSDGTAGRLGVLATRETPAAGSQSGSADASPPATRIIDYHGRLAGALENGVPMEAEDLHYLYALEMRTWAPTSERSRGQAGYGVY